MLIDLLVDKHRVDSFVNFLTQIIELPSSTIFFKKPLLIRLSKVVLEFRKR